MIVAISIGEKRCGRPRMGACSVANRDRGRFPRLKTLCNLALLLLQLITLAAYWGMVSARPSYMAISQELYPSSERLMNSWFADTLVSMPAMLVVGAIFVLSVAKEFASLSKVRRIQFNALILGVLLVVLYLAASPLYVAAA